MHPHPSKRQVEIVPVCKCFCCDKVLQTEPDAFSGDHTTLVPAYDGVWFRAHGNFGSTVFDPILDKVSGKELFLQILICDDCLKKKADDVACIYNICRKETADVESLASRMERKDG